MHAPGPRSPARGAGPSAAPGWAATALVVITSACVLVLEIVANRLVAPYVGLTLETTSAAIGVALGGIAAGAALGGRMADLVDPRRWLGHAVTLGGLLVLTARPVVVAVGGGLGSGPVATVILIALAVGPAALVLTTVTPGVVKLRLRDLDRTGETVGRLSAAGTLGALAGTFLTGFVLLNAASTSVVLVVMGLLLVVLGLVTTALLGRRGSRVTVAGTTAVALLATLLAVSTQGPCLVETRYYCADVVVLGDDPSELTLVLDGLRHSVVDLDDPARTVLPYTQRFADVLDALPDGPVRALHLGLGAGTVPRYLATTRPGSSGTVLEVDPGVVRLARERFGLREVPGLRVRVGDARTAITDEPAGSYDVVVGDAFGGLAVPWHLSTRELVQQVERVLRPGGIYLLNVIDHPPARFARAEAATLATAFAHVVLLGAPSLLAGETGGNHVLVASDAPLPEARLAAAGLRRDPVHAVTGAGAFRAGAQVLTDDDAPVDQLLTPYPPAQRPVG